MVNARARFDGAKWSPDVLLPLWALQLMLSMSMAGMFSWRIADTTAAASRHEGGGGGGVETAELELAWQIVNIVMATAIAGCTFFEMAKFVGEALTPWTMVLTHLIKLVCAVVVLVVDIAVYVLGQDARYSLVGIGLDLSLIVCVLALGLYAALIHRRTCAYDGYTRPFNVKSYGFSDELQSSTSFVPSIRSRRFSLRAGSVSYDKRASSSSLASTRQLLPSSGLFEIDSTPPVGQTSYSHRRDTQFDERARHASCGSHDDDDHVSPRRKHGPCRC
ncbi:hypothetical protein XA68_10325 [Ophiocordyceps unilateralis]|uniref:Uncharacterized protein n=1 Tax=Ophiocordyceps unilateralis TaxID=268505 RepID=A0A2A9P2Z4_OPHUN|nr:hypothetical protein XA68_10325 [Ophiocordyceps unilateralis]